MLRLVTIDLSNANIALFEAYEDKVLALLSKHGGEIAFRVRSVDGRTETHLLSFADTLSYEAFLTDPRRLAARPHLEQSGARASSVEVNAL